MFLLFKFHTVKKDYWESKEIKLEFMFNEEFGEASAEVLENKDIVCKLNVGKYSAEWSYRSYVEHTSFPNSDYTSELKEQLSEVFPFGLPVVFADGSFSEE